MDINIVNGIKLFDIDKLDKDEERICGFIEEYMVDECGLVYSDINANTLKPWTNEELQKFDVFPLFRKYPANYETYEDSLMATGEYALSQIVKYRVTQDSKALATASHQIYAILRVLYEGELYEKGYLPKPYGGVRRASYSHEISPDQYIKAYVALRAYQPYAPVSLKRIIDSYLVSIADYFFVRNFVHPYFEATIVNPNKAAHSICIYIPSLYIAYKVTGNRKYKDAINRFDSVLENLLNVFNIGNFNICSLLVEGLSLALDEGLEDERFKNIIKRLWEINIPMVSNDGLGYEYSGITDENQCIPGMDEEPSSLKWEFLSWRSNAKTSGVLKMSSIATLVDKYFPEIEAYKMGLFILDKIKEPKKMRRLIDMDGEQVLPQHHYLTESICGVSIASWVLGYWRLQERKIKG